MTTFTKMRWGNIAGVIDSYGAIHSEFSESGFKFHAEKWPMVTHCNWRWNWDKCVWSIADKLSREDYDAILVHLEKKYGLKFWDNGFNDLDYFKEQMDKEKASGIA